MKFFKSSLFKIVILGALCMASCEQKKEENIFEKINAEVLSNSKAYSTLKEATETIGHRLTGSDNGSRAEEFTANLFRNYGFEDVEFMEFEVEAWSRGRIDAELINEKGEKQKVKSVSLAHSPVQSDLDGEIVDMGNGLEDDYKDIGEKLKDKIALVYISILPGSGEARNLHRSEKTALAIKNGAKGIIFINQVEEGVLLTGTASVTGKLIPIPAICIGLEDGMQLKEQLKKEKMNAYISMENNSQIIKARNVIATLKGSELPDEEIIIGGHLDSWDLATGAIDNGIGSFSVIDIARTFKALNLIPKRTIKFVMFMGEEQGLLGSKAMVENLKISSKLENVKYIMNIDMAGNPIGYNAGGREEALEFIKTAGAKISAIDSEFTNKFANGAGLHSDHQPFMLEGIPVLGLVSNLDQSVYKCYHSDCDDFRHVRESDLKNTVRFSSMILLELANAQILPASKFNEEETKAFLIKHNLKEKLILGGDWKWEL
jgi:carboxypeptidase Q